MKSVSTILVVATISCAGAAEQVVFVSAVATGANDGTSWENAFVDLQDALAAAQDRMQIWVAAGTYTAGPPDVGPVHIHLVSGVGMYGGFAGWEEQVEQRDWQANETILSGDLDHDGVTDGYQILIGQSLSPGTLLDGFVLRHGSIIAQTTNPDGGALWLHNSSLTLRNCTFEFNGPVNLGGAIYAAESTLLMENCQFFSNESIWGAALALMNTSLEADGCEWLSNSASFEGGALHVAGSNIVLSNCEFHDNSAPDLGGAIKTEDDKSLMTVMQCAFIGNESGQDGGAMFLNGPASLEGCIFSGNKAVFGGGAVYGANIMITQCVFEKNLADGPPLFGSNLTIEDSLFMNNPGAVESSSGHLVMKRSDFINNNSAGYGGAVSAGGTVEIDDCLFDGNETTFGGGAIWLGQGAAEIRNTVIRDNNAQAFGGGGIASQGSLTLINCNVSDNTAHSFPGDGIYHTDGELTVVGCKLTDNFAEGIRIGSESATASATIINSTIANNPIQIYPRQGNAQVFNSIVWGIDSSASCAGECGGATSFCFCDELCCEVGDCCFDKLIQCGGCEPELGNMVFSNSIVFGLPPYDIGKDPMFIDPEIGDFRLLATSPAIDAGDNAFVPEDVEFDLEGNPRIIDGNDDGKPVVDIGAYEFTGKSPVPPDADLNDDGVVNEQDLLLLLTAWGDCASGPPVPLCTADLDGSGSVGVPDLLVLLSNWG